MNQRTLHETACLPPNGTTCPPARPSGRPCPSDALGRGEHNGGFGRKRGLGVFALIRNAHGELLLVRQANGRWGLPGGKLKADEGVLTGLVREVHEETGLRGRVVGLSAVVCRERRRYLALVFHLRVRRRDVPRARSEIVQARYFAWGDWPTPLTPQAAATLSALPLPLPRAVPWVEIALP
jgi:ADP-ribose pyrophosphatase YjhB (NUDIX family)